MSVKAIALLSGGLDSTLALRLILDQNVEVTALHMITPFCTCDSRDGCGARSIAIRLGVDYKVMTADQSYMNMVQNPKHGRGSNMNPCIDCRIHLFSHARELMYKLGADFILTGDVLGERPLTQIHKSMRTIDRESDLVGLVVRPLSAQFLPPTEPEKKGLIDRSKFLKIVGRCRQPQMRLAESLGETDYPCPAGGCLLTDSNFCIKIKEAFQHDECTVDDMFILRTGKHYRLPDGARLVVGRNATENKTLLGLARRGDVVLAIRESLPGPTAVLRRHTSEATIHLAAQIVAENSDLERSNKIPITVFPAREREKAQELSVLPLSETEVTLMRISNKQAS